MASTGPDDRRTALEVFDRVAMVTMRLALQALPVFLAIGVSEYIGRHL